VEEGTMGSSSMNEDDDLFSKMRK
jgi:hypothetical protein